MLDAPAGKLAGVLVIRFRHLHEIQVDYGYQQAEQALASFARRIGGVLRDVDIIERIGDFTLALTLPALSGSQQAELAASRILELVEVPVEIGNDKLTLKLDLGVAMYPADGHAPESLLRCAEVACDAAANTVNGYQRYSESLEDRTDLPRSYLMEREIADALRNDEFRLYMQPKIDLRTGALTGAEALLRWDRPDGRQFRPDVFIPVAENSNLIVPLTIWTLNAALRSSDELTARFPAFTVAVNLSPSALSHGDIFAHVAQATSIWCSDQPQLVLEITETALFKEPERAAQTLDALHAEGIRLSIDDFGTGYSSLSQLAALRVGELKIDKSFVQGVTRIEKNAQIVRSIIDLAHNFDMTVVAEGIEDAQTLEFLRALECDAGQGFYFARPMPVEQFIDWADSYQPRPQFASVVGLVQG
ncbi:MAG: EAL domain-containing protein [Gammaproteobacteria bacterium]|nr:EAL domain-containing protein [Gammaproteobacteria bacterium]